MNLGKIDYKMCCVLLGKVNHAFTHEQRLERELLLLEKTWKMIMNFFHVLLGTVYLGPPEESKIECNQNEN